MDTDVVLSILDEVATFDPPPARLNLSRVNEPFLDKRIFEFLRYARKNLPETALVLFSNGQALTERVVSQLEEIENFSLSISFNEWHAAEYEMVMQISYETTLGRLKGLHRRAVDRGLAFGVSLARVGTNDSRDTEFREWCEKEFPRFPVGVSARFDWLDAGQNQRSSETPNAGCEQWFSLHVLADATEAFCCIDGAGRGHPIEGQSLLELYNRPDKLHLRKYGPSRQDVSMCKLCPHGMPSLY